MELFESCCYQKGNNNTNKCKPFSVKKISKTISSHLKPNFSRVLKAVKNQGEELESSQRREEIDGLRLSVKVTRQKRFWRLTELVTKL